MTEPTGRGSGHPHQPGLAWQRWLRSEEPTGPVPLVERLRGTPFRDPSRMGAPQEQEAREVIEFGLRLGELLLRSGSGTRDVEAALIAVTAAMGLTDVEVDITAQSILLQHAPAEGRPVNLLRVARTQSRDHARLAQAYRLVSDLASGTCSREEASSRLAAISASPKPWPRWVVSVAYGLLAAAVCALVGGGAAATVTAFAASVAVDRLGRTLARRGLVPFFITFVGAAIAGVVAVLAAQLGWIGPRDAGAVIAGGIVVLLPGRLLVAAVEDAIFGFLVTANGRVLQVLLTGAAIISGVAIALGLASRLQLDLVVDVTGTTAVDVVRGLVCAAIASLATAVAYRSPRSLVLPPVLIGVLGYGVYGLLRVVDLGGATAATAAAAVVVGLLARVLAARMRAPALVLSVPALSTLLPGLAIFRAMSLLSTDVQAGLGQLFLAMATALAIGAGVAFGDILGAPADRWWLRRAPAGPTP